MILHDCALRGCFHVIWMCGLVLTFVNGTDILMADPGATRNHALASFLIALAVTLSAALAYTHLDKNKTSTP